MDMYMMLTGCYANTPAQGSLSEKRDEIETFLCSSPRRLTSSRPLQTRTFLSSFRLVTNYQVKAALDAGAASAGPQE